MNRSRFFARWFLLAVFVFTAAGFGAQAESNLELVAKIDASVAKAVKFLASKQSPDGAWRSDVYAPFKEGDALTPLVMTALLPLPIDDDTSEPCERGMKYLAELSKRTFENKDGLKSLAYPVYTAANTTIALHQNRRAEDDAIRAKWVQALRDLQLTEATGWKPEDVEYGGWTYGHESAKKPEAGQVLGPLDQPNLSATTFALTALRIASVKPEDPTIAKARHFVEGCQDMVHAPPGDFIFIHGDAVRNKAGARKNQDGSIAGFEPYGSVMADGWRCLLACGLDRSDKRVSTTEFWLSSNYTDKSQPGSFAADREHLRNGLYFYFQCSVSRVFLETKTRSLFSSSVRVWDKPMANQLVSRQRPDGSWKNDVVDQREDDPLIATSFALPSLLACRAMLVATRPAVVKQVSDGSLICHARDVICHGEKLKYEPQPQKNTVGYWVNADDYASWKIAVEKPEEFEVIVWQGCGAGQGGSEVVVSAGDQSLPMTVEETGHFQHFKRRSLGRMKLAAGEHELTVKALRKAKDAVVDVRQIRLVPVKAGKAPR